MVGVETAVYADSADRVAIASSAGVAGEYEASSCFAYLQALAEFQARYREECSRVNIDYVPIDTSVSFDRALMEYLIQRQRKF